MTINFLFFAVKMTINIYIPRTASHHWRLRQPHVMPFFLATISGEVHIIIPLQVHLCMIWLICFWDIRWCNNVLQHCALTLWSIIVKWYWYGINVKVSSCPSWLRRLQLFIQTVGRFTMLIYNEGFLKYFCVLVFG